MAVVKVGSLVVGISGKVGGTVFTTKSSRVRTANKVRGREVRTLAAQRNKQAMQLISRSWKSINPVHRAEWLRDFKKDTYTNISGRGHCKSAFSWFKRYAYPFAVALGSIGTPRPSQFSFPYPTGFTASYNRTTDTLTVTTSSGYATINTTLFLWLSEAVTASRWSANDPYFFRVAQFFENGSVHVFSNAYGPLFGGVPAVGTAFSVKLVGIMFQQGEFPVYLPVKVTVT